MLDLEPLTVVIVLLLLSVLCINCEYLFDQQCHRPQVYIFDSKQPGRKVVLLGGTHGNEPAGSVYLSELVDDINSKKINIQSGSLVVVPRVNECGLILNTRHVPGIPSWDINRQYNNKKESKNYPSLIREYIKHIDNSDVVIDLHEGWGFFYRDKNSVGSGIFLTDTNRCNLNKTINDLISGINRNIEDKTSDSQKYFGTNIKKEIPDTLRDYCTQKSIDHVLIEISGQNDIQPMELRVAQLEYIVTFLLQNLNTI